MDTQNTTQLTNNINALLESIRVVMTEMTESTFESSKNTKSYKKFSSDLEFLKKIDNLESDTIAISEYWNDIANANELNNLVDDVESETETEPKKLRKKRNGNEVLHVILNGKLVDGATNVEVLKNTIMKIGVAKVKKLGLDADGYPFIHHIIKPSYKDNKKIHKVGAYFIVYDMKTHKKIEIINTIQQSLGLDLQVSIVSK